MHMKTDFNINKTNCTNELVSMLGQNQEDEDDLSEFLKRNGLCVSKTSFVLRPKYTNFENDDQDLPKINSYFIRTTTS